MAQIYVADEARKEAQDKLNDYQTQVIEMRERKKEHDKELKLKSSDMRKKFKEVTKIEASITKTVRFFQAF